MLSRWLIFSFIALKEVVLDNFLKSQYLLFFVHLVATEISSLMETNRRTGLVFSMSL